MKKMTKKELREVVLNELITDDNAVIIALMNLYSLQTEDEKKYEKDITRNSVGFTRQDTNYLTMKAKQVLDGYTFSPEHFETVRGKLLKYTRQLSEIKTGKIVIENPAEYTYEIDKA